MRPLHGFHGKEGWAGPGSSIPAASCIPIHMCLPVLPFPPSPLPGALGPYPGAQGKDRAAGTPGSPPSPGVGYSVTSDWGTARTELLWRGRRAEPLCLGTLLLVPMEGPVCGPGLCPLPHTTAPLAASRLTCVPSHRGRKQGTQPGHTAWVPDVCARCVCPRMHTHTALSHTQCTPLQC